MHQKIAIACFFACLSFSCLKAQVKTNFNSAIKITADGKYKKNYKLKIHDVPVPDLQKALAKDNADANNLGAKPFIIAEPVATNIDVVYLASWTNDNETAFGRFILKAPKAKSLSINFNKFYLPEGTEMFIYNEDGTMITGPVTSAENNEKQIWGSSIYKGDVLNIELRLNLKLKPNLILNISNVAYGFKDIFIEKTSGFGQSGPCNINVLCPLGTGWENERNSVVYITREDGSSLCSGAMLNNTCGVNIPYILTANHCYSQPGVPVQDVSKWRIHFQAWSATCTPSQNNDGVLFNGSSLRANWAPSDFALVQLNQTPPSNSNINYAGWSRSTTAATSGVGIHHPSGDVMKISSYSTPVVRADNATIGGINPVGDLQWIVTWNNGVTEGGSSGSPLFDQNHRIIGQLGGGPSACGATVLQDAYGRFDNSWTGGGTNATRLSSWLDPNGTNAMTTNTTNISALISTNLSLSISGNQVFCGGTSSYTVNGVPVGSNVSWQSSDASIATVAPTGNPATVTQQGYGSVIITAIVNTCGVNQSISKTLFLGAPDNNKLVLDHQATCADYSIEFGIGYETIDYCSLMEAGITDVEWDVSSPYPFYIDANYSPLGCSSVNNSGRMINFSQQGYAYSVQIRIRVLNACGWSNWSYFPLDIQDCGGGWNFIASPNPANSSIDIALDEQTVKNNKTIAIREIQITDKLGNVVKQFRYDATNKRSSLNISLLKPDVYFIRVFNGKEWKTQSIIKQ